MTNPAESPVPPAAPGTNPQGSPARERSWKTSDTVRLVIALIIAILLVAFIVDNVKTVRVGFVFFDANIGLIWVLIATALLGALIDRLIMWGVGRRNRNAAQRKAKR